MKTVIFGGTFNPIHNGHLNVVNAVKNSIKPERFILMPTSVPPHKVSCDLADDNHRLEMCRLAINGIDGVAVSDYEMKKEGRSYTVHTLEHFHELYPDDELYFVMGTDMLKTLPSWYNSARIMELATILGISREENDDREVAEYAEKIREAGGRCIILTCEPVEVSSTDIREGIDTEFVKPLLPKSVYDYIKANNLYLDGDTETIDESLVSEYKTHMKAHLGDKRYNHSICVADEAVKLARRFGGDVAKAYYCGLLHDMCKEMTYDKQREIMLSGDFEISSVELNAPKTYHAIAGAVYVKTHLGITDEEMLNAIRYHTVARGSMTLLEKILYMADLISADRKYADVDRIRQVTYEDLDMGMYEAMKFSIEDSTSLVRTIPHSTLDAYNEYTIYANYKTGKK